MRKVTAADLERVGQEMGVEVADKGDGWEAESPSGKVFRANGIHFMVSACEYHEAPWPAKPKKVKGTDADTRLDMMERLEMGLDDCTDPVCDYCHPED